MTEHEIFIPIAIALAAIAITQTITIVKDYQKRNNERNLVRNLVNSDFARIQSLKNKDLNNTSKSLEKINKNDLSEINDLITKKKDYITFVLETSGSYNLNFWDAILHSGSLIKLTQNDIRTIQAAKKFILATSEGMYDYRLNFPKILNKIINNNDSKEKKQADIKNLIQSRLTIMSDTYQNLQTVLDSVFKLKWMDSDIDY